MLLFCQIGFWWVVIHWWYRVGEVVVVVVASFELGEAGGVGS